MPGIGNGTSRALVPFQSRQGIGSSYLPASLLRYKNSSVFTVGPPDLRHPLSRERKVGHCSQSVDLFAWSSARLKGLILRISGIDVGHLQQRTTL